MGRPKKPRRICSFPEYCRFTASESDSQETTVLSLDEFEAVRLVDYEGLSQEEAAERLDVSRPSVTNMCEVARKKIMDALVHGKTLVISGGQVHLCKRRGMNCRHCCSNPELLSKTYTKGSQIMRIAIPFQAGQICPHFGRAPQFKLVDVTEGTVESIVTIDTEGSGHGAIASFLEANNVDVVICGGIGTGARMALASMGIELIPGVSGNPGQAVEAFLEGKLEPGDPAGAVGATCGCGCGGHGEAHSHEGGCGCGGHDHEEGGCGCGGHGHGHNGGCGCGHA